MKGWNGRSVFRGATAWGSVLGCLALGVLLPGCADMASPDVPVEALDYHSVVFDESFLVGGRPISVLLVRPAQPGELEATYSRRLAETWVEGLIRTVKPGGTLVIGDIHRESRGFRTRRGAKPNALGVPMVCVCSHHLDRHEPHVFRAPDASHGVGEHDASGKAKGADRLYYNFKTYHAGFGEAEERQIRGTLLWAAPEILDGAAPSARADVFAFGVVIWEIASYCQRRPYHRLEMSEVGICLRLSGADMRLRS